MAWRSSSRMRTRQRERSQPDAHLIVPCTKTSAEGLANRRIPYPVPRSDGSIPRITSCRLLGVNDSVKTGAAVRFSPRTLLFICSNWRGLMPIAGMLPKEGGFAKQKPELFVAASDHGRCRHGRLFTLGLVPKLPKNIAAIGKKMAIGSENFERNCSVISALLERSDMFGDIKITTAQRQVQIGAPAFIVVQVNVSESRSVVFENFGGRIFFHHQVGMPDVQVKTEARQRVEQLGELRQSVEFTRQILDHQSHTTFLRDRQQFAQALDIPFDDPFSIVHRHIAIRMNIHPFGAKLRKRFDAIFQFFDCSLANAFERAAKRKVKRSVPNHRKPMFQQSFPNVLQVNLPYCRRRWL